MKWLLLAFVAAANGTPDDDGDDDDGGPAGPYPYGVILVMCGVVALGFCVGYFLLARVALAHEGRVRREAVAELFLGGEVSATSDGATTRPSAPSSSCAPSPAAGAKKRHQSERFVFERLTSRFGPGHLARPGSGRSALELRAFPTLASVRTEDRLALVEAAAHTLAAVEGLPHQPRSGAAALELLCFRVRYGARYRLFMVATCVAHASLIFFGEGTCADDHYDSARRHRPLAAELGFLGIYVADIALAYRVHRIFSVFRGPLILHQLCVLVIAADVFNCGLAFARNGRRPVRFSRGLRALLLISHSDWLAYALRQLRRSLLEIVDQLVVGAVCILVLTLAGLALYEDEGLEAGDFFVNDLARADRALVTLARMLTFANVDASMNGDAIYRRPSLLVYLVACVLFAWLFTTVFLGRLTMMQTKHRQIDVLYMIRQQAMNLEAAFRLLAVDHAMEPEPVVLKRTWEQLLLLVRPQTRAFSVDLFFRAVDKDGDGRINLREFVDVGDVIIMSVREVPRPKEPSRGTTQRLALSSSTAARARAVLDHRGFNAAMLALSAACALLDLGAVDRAAAARAHVAVGALCCGEVVARELVRRSKLFADGDAFDDATHATATRRRLDRADAWLTLGTSAGAVAAAAAGAGGAKAATVFARCRAFRILFSLHRCDVSLGGEPLNVGRVRFENDWNPSFSYQAIVSSWRDAPSTSRSPSPSTSTAKTDQAWYASSSMRRSVNDCDPSFSCHANVSAVYSAESASASPSPSRSIAKASEAKSPSGAMIRSVKDCEPSFSYHAKWPLYRNNDSGSTSPSPSTSIAKTE